MRIALVVHDYDRLRGHGRYVVELARRFRAEHEVHVFANRFDPPEEEGVVFHRVPAWRRTAQTGILTFLAAADRQIHPGGRRRFDIVHAQGLSNRRFDVVTAHICNAAWYRALGEAGLPIGPRQRLFRLFVQPLERRLYRTRRERQVIAISERIRVDLAREYGRRENVRVLYHGIDLDGFRPASAERRSAARARLGLDPKAITFLYVGDPRKGAAAAIEAVAATPGARLVAVGGESVEPYRRQAVVLGAAERVLFLPTRKAIEELYAAADAFLSPTPYDAYGMVISEAMAAGLPVVVSRRAGASELVEDEASGLLVDGPADRRTLTRAVARLAADGEMRSRLGRAARAAVEPWTWDRVAGETLEIYEAALRRRRAGATEEEA